MYDSHLNQHINTNEKKKKEKIISLTAPAQLNMMISI